MADAAVLKELAPNGKLRLAIAVAPSPSAQFAIKDGDSYRGVAITFGRALAAKLGVPLEIIPHQASGEIQNSAAANRWDVAFLPVDEERKKFVDFGNAYHLLQSTFLVAPGSKIQSVKDADAKGVGIGGVSNTATFRAAKKATANATHIDFAGVDAAVAAMRESKIEAIALSRESLSGLVGKIAGSRILDDAFLNSSTAVCVPKGKPAALGYVSDFIEEAKASGLVRKALDEMGLKSSQIAPAGMKHCVARGRRYIWRVNVLRPYPERHYAAWNAPQQRPLHQLHEKRRSWLLASERRADDVVLQDDLHALSKTRGKFATLLHALEGFDRCRSAAQRLGKNICGGNRVLHCQIDANPTNRRHGVRRVPDAEAQAVD